ncbi:uncharacterized protein J3R85_015894 [Psidium guajava]|nr:uncharacterized protein J3R85_015894 [Psidium guajava]
MEGIGSFGWLGDRAFAAKVPKQSPEEGRKGGRALAKAPTRLRSLDGDCVVGKKRRRRRRENGRAGVKPQRSKSTSWTGLTFALGLCPLLRPMRCLHVPAVDSWVPASFPQLLGLPSLLVCFPTVFAV